MKIVICGAGLVGNAIARHLSAEGNDVTVIDHDADRLQRLVDIADVSAVEGVASHPNILRYRNKLEFFQFIPITTFIKP